MDKHAMHQGSCCAPMGGGHGCCGFRHFYTNEEKREHLERYKESLKKELEAVEEQLKGM
jgi:hypothetical protein